MEPTRLLINNKYTCTCTCSLWNLLHSSIVTSTHVHVHVLMEPSTLLLQVHMYMYLLNLLDFSSILSSYKYTCICTYGTY